MIFIEQPEPINTFKSVSDLTELIGGVCQSLLQIYLNALGNILLVSLHTLLLPQSVTQVVVHLPHLRTDSRPGHQLVFQPHLLHGFHQFNLCTCNCLLQFLLQILNYFIFLNDSALKVLILSDNIVNFSYFSTIALKFGFNDLFL